MFIGLLGILLLRIIILTKTQEYYFPLLNLQNTLQKNTPTQFDQISKFQTNGMRIFELYQNGTLISSEISNQITQQILFENQILDSQNISQSVIDFSFDRFRDNQIHFLTDSEEISTYDINSFTEIGRIFLENITISNNSILENTNQTFFIIDENEGRAIINRIFRTDLINMTYVQDFGVRQGFNISEFQQIPQFIITEIEGDQFKTKICQNYDTTFQYLAIWNTSYYLEIYKCGYFDCQRTAVIDLNLAYNGTLNGTEEFKEILNFHYNCQKMYLYVESLLSPTTFNTQNGEILVSFQEDPTSQIVDFGPFAGAYDFTSIVYSNGSINLYEVSNGTWVKQYKAFTFGDNIARYQWNHRRLVVHYADFVQVYKFECWTMTYFDYWRHQCTNCSNTCASCDIQNGYCQTCIDGLFINYSLIRQMCHPPIDQNQTITNQTILNPPQQQAPSQVNALGALYDYEYLIASSLLDGMEIIGQLIGVVIKSLMIIPAAWLFLSFMNFWSVCSYYVLLNVQIPQYLKIVLKVIYDKINSPIFGFDDMVKGMYPLQQKLPQFQEEFGISISFLLNNFEGLLIFSFSVLIAKVMTLTISYCPKNGWIYKNLSNFFNLQQIASSQFISAASGYILPFDLIIKNLSRQSWKNFLNLTFHIFFMGFSLIFPFLIFQKNGISEKQKSKNLNKQALQKLIQKRKQQKKQLWGWIYDSNSNTILPLLCVLKWPYLYLIFGVPYFLLGLRLAFQAQKYRINEIILALYRVLFHIFFLAAFIFNGVSESISHNCALACTMILFVGALHQFINFFFQIGGFVVSSVKKVIKARKNVKDEPINNPVQEQYLQSHEKSSTNQTQLVKKPISEQAPIDMINFELTHKQRLFNNRYNLRLRKPKGQKMDKSRFQFVQNQSQQSQSPNLQTLVESVHLQLQKTQKKSIVPQRLSLFNNQEKLSIKKKLVQKFRNSFIVPNLQVIDSIDSKT